MINFNRLDDSQIADVMLNDENAEIDLSDVEDYCRNFGGVKSNADLNGMFDSWMQEVCPSVTAENDNEYDGEYYSNYKDMLRDEGAIHTLQDDNYSYFAVS